jgi:hypothetical protein
MLKVPGFRLLKCVLSLVSMAFLCMACSKAIPAGFWKSYHHESIVRQASDQGPWGGWRWIHWEADKTGTFSEKDILLFAEKHGWSFLEKREYSKQDIESWHTFGNPFKPIFPLLYPEHGKGAYAVGVEKFPRHILDDSIVLKFGSRWITIDPGSGKASIAYGYVQLSKDGKLLALYHSWGE